MTVERMPKTGGKTVAVDKPAKTVHKAAQKKITKPVGYSHFPVKIRRYIDSGEHGKFLGVSAKDSAEPIYEFEKLSIHRSDALSQRGNRPGTNGREGYKAPATMERLVAKRHMVSRIVQSTDALLNAALNKAHGEQYLMCRIETGKGRDKKIHTEIVTDPQTMLDYLVDMGESMNTDGQNGESKEYYYLTRKPADGQIIRDLLDRGYGRATEKVELGGKDEGDLEELKDEELDARINSYLQRRRRTA